MKRCKKMLTVFVLVFALVGTLGSTCHLYADTSDGEQKAEKTYTVTFRAGNVGSFNEAIVEDTKDLIVTENYVKFTVKKGESLPFDSDESLSEFIQTLTAGFIENNYRLRPMSDWANGAATEEIYRNKEYVLDYVFCQKMRKKVDINFLCR